MKPINSISRKKIVIIIAFFILFFLLFPYNGWARNNGPNTIVLLGNKDLAPIVYDDKGKSKGVAVDIAKAIGDKIDYEIKILTTNWEQAQRMILNGEADGLLQINPNPERDKIYDFSSPLLKSEFSIFVQSDNLTINNIDDLRGKKVGVEAGGYPNKLLEGYGEVDIVLINDWKTSFKELSSGNLDGILVDRWIGEYQLANSRIKGIKIVETPIETQYSRIAVPKGDDQTLSLINSGLKEITEDGTIDKIMKQWQSKRVVYITEDYYYTFFLRSVILILLSVTLIILFLLLRYQRLSKRLEDSVKERTEELRYTNEMLKAANIKLEEMSMMDGLTSIKNRRAFDIAYSKAWKVSLREGLPLSLIMIDIDHFKIFNDTYGHLAGDQALIKIAEIIKGGIKRPGDFTARYGGEEFVVMLMNTTSEGATIVAEKIRKTIEDLRMKNEEINSNLTISLGVASIVPSDKMDSNKLIEAADKALYKAKKEGRNKVIV